MAGFIDEEKIHSVLDECRNPSPEQCGQAIRSAKELRGLGLEGAAMLLQATDRKTIKEIFSAAREVKERVYGSRLVFFAPLYISDYCVNDCAYCGFHCSNLMLGRKRLTMEEIAEQAGRIIRLGHKRILLEAGEHPEISIDYVCDAIRAIYGTKAGNGEIRRVNVNIAATSVENYRKLKQAGIGTYQLFQETYHRGTYGQLHKGPKADYDRQITAHGRAFEAGIDDYGMGVLFGLYDCRFEALSLLAHARHMENEYGVGPHTISVPRFRPAPSVAYAPKFPVSDQDFLRLIAVIRLALPYVGMILSTREPPNLRKKAFEIGISQASAGSRASAGGYSKNENVQFELADHRPVDEVVQSVCRQGLLPSFCTACYRSGRTGEYFMKFAKSGTIHNFCLPNALLTFKEYLIDYGNEKLNGLGERIIRKELEKIPDAGRRQETLRRLRAIENGKRDLYF